MLGIGKKGRYKKEKILVLGIFVFFSSCFLNLITGTSNNVSAASVSSTEVGSYGISGSAQSMAYDSDKNRIVVFSPSGQAVIIDASSLKKIGTENFSGGGHCNGATYNPTHKVFAVAPTSKYYSGGYYIYDTNISRQGVIYANPGGAIAYSRKNGVYYASGAGNFKTIKCNNATGTCSVSNKFHLDLSGSNQQDADTYGKYYYLCTKNNSIHKIDMDSKSKVATYSVGGSELEGIIFVGEKAYTLHHHSGGGSFSIRQIADSDVKQMLSGAGDNNFSGSTSDGNDARTAVSTTKPKDVSRYKNAMRASAKKKLKKRNTKVEKIKITSPCTSILPEAWCSDENAVFKVINLALYVITAGVGILGMAGIVWMGLIYLTARDSVDRTRLAKRRLLEIIIGMFLWGAFFAISRWFLVGEI